MKNVVIVGGGFAGVWAAAAAAKTSFEHDADVAVTLVSKDPYLTVRPRLYEVPAAGHQLPLADTLDPIGARLILGTAVGIDTSAGRLRVQIEDREQWLPYDRLVLSTGSRRHLPPVPGLADYAWNIDDFESATAFDNHLAEVFGRPQSESGRCVVVLGAGFTGLELVLEMRARIAAHSDEATAAAARIVLIDHSERAGKQLGEAPRPYIEAAIADARIETHLGVSVQSVTPQGLQLSDGDHIATDTVVAAMGFRANLPFDLPGASLDNLGRLVTERSLRVSGVEGVFAAGDTALARTDDDHFALMSCQHAIPMGQTAGRNAVLDLLGLPLDEHSQLRYVTCLDLGPSGAIFTEGWDRQVKLTGDAGKARKREINEVWISPPRGTRDEIFAAIGAPPARRPMAAGASS